MNKFASSSTARCCSPFLLLHNLLAVLFPVKPSCRFLTSTSRARRCVQYPGSFVLVRLCFVFIPSATRDPYCLLECFIRSRQSDVLALSTYDDSGLCPRNQTIFKFKI